MVGRAEPVGSRAAVEQVDPATAVEQISDVKTIRRPSGDQLAMLAVCSKSRVSCFRPRPSASIT